MDGDFSADSTMRQILLEVVEEEIMNLLEEVVLDDEQSTSSQHQSRELVELATWHLADEIINETLILEFTAVAGECFDDVISGHRTDLSAVQRMNSLLRQVVKEMLEDIALEIIGEKFSKVKCTALAEALLTEVIDEESYDISSKVMDHYLMRVSLLQYEHIKASASGVLMDKVLLESLLSHYENDSDDIFSITVDEKDKILNEILLDILLSQSSALHSCFPRNLPTQVWKDVPSSKLQPVECIPLNWYKEKLAISVAEDVALTMLCRRLDESMRFSAEQHLKNEAASLITQFLGD